MKKTILRSVLLPSLYGRVGVGLSVLFLLSCTGKPSLAEVAEEDSLRIDTVATLDDMALPDTTACADSLIVDSL